MYRWQDQPTRLNKWIPITRPNVTAISLGGVDSWASVIRETSDKLRAIPKSTGYPYVCVLVDGVVVAITVKKATNTINDATVSQRTFLVMAQHMPAPTAEKMHTIMVTL